MDTQLGSQFTRQLGLPAGTTKRAPVDLATVNPVYKSIYEAYNNSLGTYDQSEDAARQYANTSQQNLNNELAGTLTKIDQGRIAQTDVARQGGRDAQTNNRVRARAIGGAPSSGFLELANRIDSDTNKGIMGIGQNASNQAFSARSQTLKALGDIERDLNGELVRINSQRDLSLRERDNAIAQAVERARAAALSAAALGGGMNSGGNVLGDSSTNSREDDFAIDTETGEGGFPIEGGQRLADSILPGVARAASFLNIPGYAVPQVSQQQGQQQRRNFYGATGTQGLVNSVTQNDFLNDLFRRAGDVGNAFAGGRNVLPGYYNY